LWEKELPVVLHCFSWSFQAHFPVHVLGETHTPPPPSCSKQSKLTKTPLFFSKAIVEEGTRTKTGKYYSLQPRITLLSFFLSQTEQVFSVSSNVQTKLLPTEDTIMGSLINSYAKAFTTTAAHVHHMNV